MGCVPRNVGFACVTVQGCRGAAHSLLNVLCYIMSSMYDSFNMWLKLQVYPSPSLQHDKFGVSPFGAIGVCACTSRSQFFRCSFEYSSEWDSTLSTIHICFAFKLCASSAVSPHSVIAIPHVTLMIISDFRLGIHMKHETVSLLTITWIRSIENCKNVWLTRI
jgi:hypothetical protein